MSYYTPRVVHVPAGKGVVKWMSGDVYETMATAESTDGSVGFTVCWVPPGNGPVAHVHKSADESFYLISGSLEFLNGDRLLLEGGDDPVPGGKPEFWPPERGMALGPLLGRTEIDMEILPEQTDLGGPADEA